MPLKQAGENSIKLFKTSNKNWPNPTKQAGEYYL